MNIIDVSIVLLLLLGGVLGFKAGAIKKLTSFLGLFIVIILSFYLKNYLSVLLYENLPFFDFWGVIKGVGVVNILLYEIVSFVIIFALLMFLLRVLIVISGLFEKLLKATIFLSIPSKIAGIFVGFVEAYVYIFIALFVFSLPVFSVGLLTDSKLAGKILNETPILSPIADKTLSTYREIYNIIDNRGNKTNEQLNEEALIFMLENNIITVESANKLIEQNKIRVNDSSFIIVYQNSQNI